MHDQTVTKMESKLDAIKPHWRKDDIIFWQALANFGEHANELLLIRKSNHDT